MKFKQKAVWFLSGVLVTAMVASVASPALAALATRTIQVATGVSIYLDDKKFDATDVNGKSVEPFILDGTTYLPVRAISEALGVPIQWEGSTWSVYVGKHSSDKPAVWLSQMDYFSGTAGNKFYTEASASDNLGNLHYQCITRGFDRTYKLNGQYSRMTGVLYQAYEYRSHDIGSGYGVTIYGDGEILYDKRTQNTLKGGGFDPANFSIDLTGVLELRVVFYNGGTYGRALCLGDVGLYT